MSNPRLVLASASPARARLLAGAGLTFEVMPARIDETTIKEAMRAESAPAAHIAEALAELKAQRQSTNDPTSFVIGADQVLSCEKHQFDKPASHAEARAQLLALRGKTHSLTSAVVVARGGSAIWRHVEPARLTMRTFSDTFLDEYLDRAGGDILHSIGAYQLEGLGAQLFSRIDGDYFCILGLPLLPLLDFLRQHQVVRL